MENDDDKLLVFYRIIYPNGINEVNVYNDNDYNCTIINKNINNTTNILNSIKYLPCSYKFNVSVFVLSTIEQYTGGIFKSHDINTDSLKKFDSNNHILNTNALIRCDYNDMNNSRDVRHIWVFVSDHAHSLPIINNSIRIKILFFSSNVSKIDSKLNGIDLLQNDSLTNAAYKDYSNTGNIDGLNHELDNDDVLSSNVNIWDMPSPCVDARFNQNEDINDEIDKVDVKKYYFDDDFFNFEDKRCNLSLDESGLNKEESEEICNRIRLWSHTNGDKLKDIRTLLSTLNNILWDDVSWNPMPMSLLIGDCESIKKYYKRALLVCHPDKQKTSTWQRKLESELITQSLQDAWHKLNTL